MQTTQLLGFRPGRHEGKVTGLAAYGNKAVCEKEYRRLIRYERDSFKVVNTVSKSHKIYKEIMKHNREDIAASLQYVFEETITRFIKAQMERYNKKNVEQT
ncbi:Carbamoyltransferase, partial [Candidatus Magnetobacterium bavaricum]